jgi:two-component system, chemotaxis family, response regulator Rcp1
MPVVVLLVEDNLGDVRLTQEALKDAKVAVQLHVAWDGVEAMSFLRHEGTYGDAPRPDFILLDLKMPRMDGCEVLTQIKNDERLRTIPTLVLTTSEAEADIMRSYHLYGNSYLCKPVQADNFQALLHGITDFWLNKARLPRQWLDTRG